MDRGLRRVPDSNPPIPSLGSHNSLFPLQSFSLLILVERKEVRGKKKQPSKPFQKSRWNKESREVVYNLPRPAHFIF